MMHIETIVVGTFQVNCFILWNDSRQAIVIDPGGDTEDILTALHDGKCSVACYLLTHGHVDHITALAEVHRAMPAPIAIHSADRSWAFEPRNEMPPFYPAPQRPDDEIAALEDNQQCSAGGMEYRVIATPGHSPGSVCFFFPEEKTLFCGDTLFAGSVGRTDLPGGDPRLLSKSLATLALMPEETLVYPGHGPASTIAREKETNFFMQSLRV